MVRIRYDDLADRLTPEAMELFREMVAAHLEAGSGTRLFLRADTLQGSALVLSTRGRRWDWRDVDTGALDDLAGYRLLHVGYSQRGTPNYRVSGEGIAFHRWLISEAGSPVAQVDDEVRRALASPDFAARHPGAAHHLAEAFSLLWADRTDEQTVSEIGDHLRKALMDTAADVAGDAGGRAEQPVQRLRRKLDAVKADLPEREVGVLERLVDLADAVLRLDHRLNHVRDEADKGEPPARWEELRRAGFTSALVCYELDRFSG